MNPDDPLKHHEAAVKKQLRAGIKKLRSLHLAVYPDPPEVAASRAKWPHLIEKAFWVPYYVHETDALAQYIYFLTVCDDPDEGDDTPRIRLVVVQYVPGRHDVDAPAWQRKGLYKIIARAPIAPGLIGTLADTYRMFFTYSTSLAVKKLVYTQELDRKASQKTGMSGLVNEEKNPLLEGG